jgi:hypothetical protein
MLSVFFLSSTGFVYLKMTHQLTPGPLSNYHKNGPLGGVNSHAELSTQCTHCHAPIHCLEDATCQECHINIARDRTDVTTLHGKLPNVSRCQNCHPEHRGAEADLVNVAFHNFDHFALVGYSLAGHVKNYDGTEFTCSSCHFKSGDIAESLDCTSCHAAEDHDATARHVEEYGSRCLECHDGVDRMMVEFNHDPYLPLQGGHQDIACGACHGETYPEGLNATCKTCHEDPEIHAGEFGLDCIRCHTDAAWTPAELRIHVFELDHGEEEASEACTSCHIGTYAEYTCDSCHDPEEMQAGQILTGVSDIQNCIACHPTGRSGEASTEPVPGEPTIVTDEGHTRQDQNGAPDNAPTSTTDKIGKDGSK